MLRSAAVLPPNSRMGTGTEELSSRLEKTARWSTFSMWIMVTLKRRMSQKLSAWILSFSVWATRQFAALWKVSIQCKSISCSQNIYLPPKISEFYFDLLSICSSEDKWSEEAIDFFESMTFDLDTKKTLLAKSQGYCENAESFIPLVILKTVQVIYNKNTLWVFNILCD